MKTSKTKRPNQSQDNGTRTEKHVPVQMADQPGWSSDRAAVLRTAAKLRRPGACDCACNCCGD